jgi:hypothetical protein
MYVVARALFPSPPFRISNKTFLHDFGVGHKIDHDQGVLPRPHTARKGVPVEQQDTHHICVRARLATRGRQIGQIHIMYVSTRQPIRRVYWSIGLNKLLFSTTASNPPPRDLKVSDPAVRDLTLGELGLAPSSILHLRFVDDGLNRERVPFSSGSFGSSSPPPL